MSEGAATLLLGGMMLAVLAGGVTWSALKWLRQRTLLNMVRLGWFAVLLGLVLVVFLRNEVLASTDWLAPLALSVGVAVFVAREIAARFDPRVLLAMDIAAGIGLVLLLTILVGPGSGLPLVTVIPAAALAGVAYTAQMFKRFWTVDGAAARAEQARLVRMWALVLIPFAMIAMGLLFGGATGLPGTG